MITQKQAAMAWFARQLVGVNENGNSAIVTRMRKFVDGVASGEPWCVCFVQFCAGEVDELFGAINLPSGPALLAKTESTQQLWKDANPATRSPLPQPGNIVVWRLNADPTRGHCGIVIDASAESVVTVEGNTSAVAASTEAERNGRGVWCKRRENGDIPGYTRLGYLNPWALTAAS